MPIVYVSMQLTLCEFKASSQPNCYQDILNIDTRIMELLKLNEEDWENFKEEMIKNAISVSVKELKCRLEKIR
jgi:hypothetical protein